MSRPIESLSPQEVLALAIEIERANTLRFSAFANVFRGYDTAVADRFEELAREEEDHEARLVQHFRDQFGQEIPHVKESEVQGVIESPDLDDPEALIFDSVPPEHVYHLALKAEQGARAFYRKAASATADAGLASLFWALASLENDHVAWLEEKIKAPGQYILNPQPSPTSLEAGVDYLFCPVCKSHVPCVRVETGGWEVQCPGCAGECGLCKCYLQRFCFGSREQFPPFQAAAESTKRGKQ
jgi:rubrerythrin